jgi:hypothetical protein
MQNISEIRELIDELDAKIHDYNDTTTWSKSNASESLFPWIVEQGPKIIDSWRELAALIRLMPGDDLMGLVAKLEQIQMLVANQEVLQLAIKLNRKPEPVREE